MNAVVIGLGNAYRRDDGIGLAVAALLQDRVPVGVDVIECEQEPTRMIDAWTGVATAIVVDAVESRGSPGALHRFDAVAEGVPEKVFRSSTHAFGVGEAVELARALGRLPERMVVYGVEGSEFAAGEGLTESVQAAIEPAAQAVLEDLERLMREGQPCTSER